MNDGSGVVGANGATEAIVIECLLLNVSNRKRE